MTPTEPHDNPAASERETLAAQDAASLMASIRGRVAVRPALDAAPLPADSHSAAPLSAESLSAAESQLSAANARYAAARESLEKLLQSLAGELNNLASLSGFSRPWYDPRRWWYHLQGIVLSRQQRFNREVAARLGRLGQGESLRAQADALGSIVAAANGLMASLRGAHDAVSAQADRISAQAALVNAQAARLEAAERQADETAARITKVLALSDRLRLHEQQQLADADRLDNLQQVVASLGPAGSIPVAEATLPEGVAPGLFDFLAFEDATRGSEERIAGEQAAYLPWFQGAPGVVVDAGCGRGEFLEILRAAGIAAKGFDADPRMAAHCRAKGLEVDEGMLFEYLQDSADNSLGGLYLGQVVEHLPADALIALGALAFRKLMPGAAFAAETINPACLTTFSGAFYADPTHVKPLHPKAMEFLLQAAGFGEITVRYSVPIPADKALAPIGQSEPLPAELRTLASEANANFARLNSVMYSFANYAICGRKPSA